MRKIDSFTNRYSVNKTLRFELKPIGKTLENFKIDKVLEKDKQLTEDFSKVKKYLDRFYRSYIEEKLSALKLDGLDEYATLYYIPKKTPEQKKEVDKQENNLIKRISDYLKSDERYTQFFTNEVLDLAEKSTETDEERDILKKFKGFSTYLTTFYPSRKALFSDEKKSSGIANRCISDNLPRFLDNAKNAPKVFEALSYKMDEINSVYKGLFGVNVEEVFTVDYFSMVLAQDGISNYNQIIGGYSKDDGTKVLGLNEYINLYNQQNPDKSPISKFTKLHKQILSDVDTLSFVPQKYNNDDEVLDSIRTFFESGDESINSALNRLEEIVAKFDSYDLSHIYVENNANLTDLCNKAFGQWSAFRDEWFNNYDANHKNSGTESYLKKREASYKSNKSFSISSINNTVNQSVQSGNKSVAEYIVNTFKAQIEDIRKYYSNSITLLNTPYRAKWRLSQNFDAIAEIKDLLDSVKALEHTLHYLTGTGKEEDKDCLFYGDFLPIVEVFDKFNPLYDKVRNYMTQKLYSTDKIKLNFENSNLLGGWDQNKEAECSAVIFTKGNDFYLGVMKKNFTHSFEEIPEAKNGEEVFQKMVYKLLPGPNKMLPKVFFSKKGIERFKPDSEINRIYKQGTFKKGDNFNIRDCHTLIDFYKKAINEYSGWDTFEFDFSPTDDYQDIGEFYRDVENQGYKVTFTDVPVSYIDELVENGKMYLFRLYNKDMSEYHHKNSHNNLYTMYFNALFDDSNMKNAVYRLRGGAEMFYREASIKEDEKIIHNANLPIENKNPHTEKKSSTFEYDLIKDRRYTVDKFSLNLCISINTDGDKSGNMNEDVCQVIKECENNYIIGIDRGERNLIYISVIDESGKIVEQYSLNEIINEYNGKSHTTDYHAILEAKAKDRTDARKNWRAIEDIKELKEGYISQVVNKICQLVKKYDAIIALEDLNFPFKNSRAKFENSVYQTFETALINKLNLWVDKNADTDEVGGVMRAYQLTNKFKSFKELGKQSGIIFYVPANLTSKIDPTTGFIDFIYPKYKNVNDSKKFFSKFDSIRYSKEKDRFEFDVNCNNFEGGFNSYRKNWTLCSVGNRIECKKDGNTVLCRELRLNDMFKEVFSTYGIELSEDMKSDIVDMNDKGFFENLTNCMKLLLQMRNSMPGTNVDYIISPVAGKDGKFYCSGNDESLPLNADANGAYNIARKGLMLVSRIKETTDEKLSHNLTISTAQWTEYAQK